MANMAATTCLKTSGYLALFIFLFIAPFGACQLFPRHPTGEPTATPLCEGAIACTLEQVQLGPVEFCIEVPMRNSSDVIGLCVWDFICNQLTFASLESSFVAPHSLPVGLEDLGLDCLGEWNVTESSEGSNETKHLYEGAFSLDMVDLTVRTEMEFTHYNTIYHQPEVLLFHNCSVPQAMFEVHFLGGALGKTLDVTLAPKIEDGLEDHADELLCDVLGTALTLGLSSRILDENLHREKTIDAGKKDYPPPVINGTYDWRTSRLASFHRLMDSLTVVTEGDGDWASCLVNSSALGGLNASQWGQEEDDLLVNKLIDLLTNNTGEISVPIGSVIEVGNTSSVLVLESMTISGLDSFTNISLLVPSSESGAVLTSVLGMEDLALQIYMLLNASSSSGTYSEELVATLSLENVLLDVDLVVAISESKLSDIFVDQYLNNSDCLYLALDELSISSLGIWLDIEEMSLVQIAGDATSLEEDVVSLLDNMLEWLLKSWPVRDLIAGLGQTTIKKSINTNLSNRLSEMHSLATDTCPQHVQAAGPDYLDWNTSTSLLQFNHLVNTVIGAEGVNSFMNCVTGGTGQVTLHKNNSNTSLTLSGLNSFYEFAILYPMASEPYDLGNSIAVGQCQGEAKCTPFGVIFESHIRDRTLYLDLEMANVELFLDLLFKIDTAAIQNLNLNQMLTQGCIMTAAESLYIQNSSLHLTDAELYLDDGESDPINITNAVELIVDYFHDTGGLVSRLNAQLSELVTSAPDRCAGTYDPSADDDTSASKSDGSPRDWTWQIALLMIGCVLSLIFLAYLYHHFGVMTKEEEEFRDSLDAMQHNRASSLQEKLITDLDFENNYDAAIKQHNPTYTFAKDVLRFFGYGEVEYDALFAAPTIPLGVRICFPIAVLGCIATTIFANISVGTSVMVEIDIGDVKIEPPSIFDFALGNTVRDMWSAGVYPLSILVAFFSGAWPYIKLLTMFFLWFTPSAAVTPWRRGWCLQWLDTLGKWSLIDAYVMVMMMVAFHVELIISSNISVTVTVEPRIGFNMFLLAVLMSLGLGHIAIGCHRMDTEEKIRSSNKKKECLKEHLFCCKYFEKPLLQDGSGQEGVSVGRFQFTRFGKSLMTAMIVFSLLLVVAGVFLLTFVFHFKGLVGFILGSEDDVKYSLVTTGTAVSTATGNPNSFVVRWIQACFFGFGVVMPLFFLTLMLTAWVLPLTLPTYRKLVVLAEVANAWNAIDVFVVSVVAALLEIQQFAEFIIGDSCDTINEFLEENNPNPDGDNKCFDVTASLLPKFWVLALSAGVMMTFGLLLLKMAQKDLQERQREDRGASFVDEIMLRSSASRRISDLKAPLYEPKESLSPESSLSNLPSDMSGSTLYKDSSVAMTDKSRVASRSDQCAAYFTLMLTKMKLIRRCDESETYSKNQH